MNKISRGAGLANFKLQTKMKKLFLLLAVVGLAAFSSCKKDDDDGSLAGTEWLCVETYEGTTYTDRIVFISGSQAHWEVTRTPYDPDYDDYFTVSYRYKHPNITFINDEYDMTVPGTINGNKMTLVIDEDEVYIFTKQ